MRHASGGVSNWQPQPEVRRAPPPMAMECPYPSPFAPPWRPGQSTRAKASTTRIQGTHTDGRPSFPAGPARPPPQARKHGSASRPNCPRAKSGLTKDCAFPSRRCRQHYRKARANPRDVGVRRAHPQRIPLVQPEPPSPGAQSEAVNKPSHHHRGWRHRHALCAWTSPGGSWDGSSSSFFMWPVGAVQVDRRESLGCALRMPLSFGFANAFR